MTKVVVAGVGMTQFYKPKESPMYDVLGADAVRMALKNAGLEYNKIQQAYVGYVYGDSTAGQRSLYPVGTTGIPIINVNNNCSTGSTSLYLARQAVESGMFDCVLAAGFEQMKPGAIGNVFDDRPGPLDGFLDIANQKYENVESVPMAIKLFGGAGQEYQEKYGMKTESFAKVRVKAAEHAIHNDRAIFRSPLSIEQVMDDGNYIFANLTRLQCCPPTCGAAAVIICSEEFARKNGLRQDVVITGQALTTDYADSFNEGSLMKAVGSEMTRSAAQMVYDQMGIGPEEVNLVELHDCFATNEVITYEGLGLCKEGEAEKFIWDGDNTYGGRVVTNPSGGLLSKGHPLGATGLAQTFELVSQLRGECGVRQVEGAKIAIAHNLGLGGACVVTGFQKN